MALLPFFILVGLFEILPILSIIVRSFMPQGGAIGITLENYIRIFTTMLYQSAIINSLFIAVCSSVIGLAVAFLGAKAAYEKGGRAKKIFMSILNMVSNFSGVPLAFAYIIMLGNKGVVNLIGLKVGIGFLADIQIHLRRLDLFIVGFYLYIVQQITPLRNELADRTPSQHQDEKSQKKYYRKRFIHISNGEQCKFVRQR